MAIDWVVPKYSKNKIDGAGRSLSQSQTPGAVRDENALEIIDNWRAAHAFPLNTMQNTLRRKDQSISKMTIVAQRLKRLPSIQSKLALQGSMRLSRMQDIGGCRAVVSTAAQVERLVSAYKQSYLKHKLIREHDYITNPKSSGYRSYHLIYKYHSDTKETYNGMQIEIQIRSNMQHRWATAVETAGMFLGQSLKSSVGNQSWLRFFTLMGSHYAVKENRPMVCGTAENLTEEIKHYINQLNAIEYLGTFGRIARRIEDITDSEYVLIQLDLDRRIVRAKGFKKAQLNDALIAYRDAEEHFENVANGDTVLASVKNIKALRKLYPNYFWDINSFLRELKSIT